MEQNQPAQQILRNQILTTQEQVIIGDAQLPTERFEENFMPRGLVEKVDDRPKLTLEQARAERDKLEFYEMQYIGRILVPPIERSLFFRLEPLDDTGQTSKDPTIGIMTEDEEGKRVFTEIPPEERDLLAEIGAMLKKDDNVDLPLRREQQIQQEKEASDTPPEGTNGEGTPSSRL
jgi:hypothetical protein